MNTTISDSQLEQLLDVARFAPSVHNTQPWVVTAHDNVVVITIDPTHRLHDGDPTGRETIISLGIFAEALCLATSTVGFTASQVRLDDEVCSILLEPTSAPSNDEAIGLLLTRSTDRSVYKPAEVPTALVNELEAAETGSRSKIVVTTDPTLIGKVAQLTSQGIQLALSSPGFRHELSKYLVVPGSGKKRGIATRSLYIPRPLQYFEPWLIRLGLQTGAEVKLEKRRWQSASGVVFICSECDLHKDWFEVGRNYLHVSLLIEKAGLSQATSAAIVEASDFHEDIEKQLGTQLRIQAMIRIGRGKRRRYSSPRVSARELLATSN